MPPKKETKEKNQHIQVAVRCRPLNSYEKKSGSHNVVEINKDAREVTVKERLGPTAPTKTFSFDKVFNAQSKQIELYKAVVAPTLDDVCAGFNCTIFAYGQTGTGKTFTMEGERSNDSSISWQDDPLTGVIPRAMHHLFTKLTRQACEFSVRVSFLEIYNEELIDLLGAESVENPRLKIYEDATKKGTCVIQGLEEVIVRTKDEVYGILERGRQRRQTAATLLNASSSRSHSLFMVTIHMKENSIEGEELLKTGKLNLVDLAGSENIGRSGAVDKRAREAGNINQSLLTLGRVITALVEHAPHVPYRESKLTRLLQDSLGGRTKTSIIATISPASMNLDETLSTLDYAFRAKNITNRPEINQKLTKKALMKEYGEEIERLRRDLQAARDKNGIFMDEDNYNDIQIKIAQQQDIIKECDEKIIMLETERDKLNDMFAETKEELLETKDTLVKTQVDLEDTTDKLKSTTSNLYRTRKDRDEQKHLVTQHIKTETKLHEQASQLLHTVGETTGDVAGLHAKLDRKRKVESTNEQIQSHFRQDFQQDMSSMQEDLSTFTQDHAQLSTQLQEKIASIEQQSGVEAEGVTEQLSSLLSSITEKVQQTHSDYTQHAQHTHQWLKDVTDKCETAKSAEVSRQCDFQQQVLEKAMGNMQEVLNSITTDMSELAAMLTQQMASQQQKLQNIVAAQAALLGKQQALIDDYATKQRAHLSTHADSLNAMLTSHNQLTQSVADRLQATLTALVKEQQESLCNSVALLSQQVTTAQDNTATMQAQATSGFEELQREEKQGEEEMLTTTKQHCHNTQPPINKIVATVENLSSQRAQLQNNITEFSKQTQQNVRDHSEDLVAAMREQGEHVERGIQQHQSATQMVGADASERVSFMHGLVSEQQRQLSGELQCVSASVASGAEKQADWSRAHHQGLSRRAAQLTSFLQEELQRDVPTGQTPERRDFHYPNKLSARKSDGELLRDFRGNYKLEEAINTPIPDNDSSFNSNSVVSQLPELQDAEDEEEGGEGVKRSTVSPSASQLNVSADSAVSSASQVSSVMSAIDGECKENVMGPPSALPIASQNKSQSKSGPSNNKSTSHSRTNSASSTSSGKHSRQNSETSHNSSDTTSGRPSKLKKVGAKHESRTPHKGTVGGQPGARSRSRSQTPSKPATKLPLRSSNQ